MLNDIMKKYRPAAFLKSLGRRLKNDGMTRDGILMVSVGFLSRVFNCVYLLMTRIPQYGFDKRLLFFFNQRKDRKLLFDGRGFLKSYSTVFSRDSVEAVINNIHIKGSVSMEVIVPFYVQLARFVATCLVESGNKQMVVES